MDRGVSCWIKGFMYWILIHETQVFQSRSFSFLWVFLFYFQNNINFTLFIKQAPLTHLLWRSLWIRIGYVVSRVNTRLIETCGAVVFYISLGATAVVVDSTQEYSSLIIIFYNYVKLCSFTVQGEAIMFCFNCFKVLTRWWYVGILSFRICSDRRNAVAMFSVAVVTAVAQFR